MRFAGGSKLFVFSTLFKIKMANINNKNKLDSKFRSSQDSPFNKKKCLELLNINSFSDVFLKNQKTEKIFSQKIITLEKYNLTSTLALKHYLEEILLTCPSEQYLAYKEQLNVLSKILTLTEQTYYFMEKGIFHRVMAYGYTFPNEIGRLYSYSSSMPRLKREIRYLMFKNIYKDVDIENAHPSILLEYSWAKGLKTPLLEKLVKDRSSFYKILSEELQCDEKHIKLIVLKSLNQIPKEIENIYFSNLLTSFFKEILIIRDAIWEDNYKNIKLFLSQKAHFVKKTIEKKKVTVMSLFCQTRESEILLDLYAFLQELATPTTENDGMTFIPFFDGAYISFKENTDQNLLDNWIELFNKNQSVIKFKIKKIETEANLLVEDYFLKICHLNELFKKFSYNFSQDVLKVLVLDEPILNESNLQLLIKLADDLKKVNQDLTDNINSLRKEFRKYKLKEDEKMFIIEEKLKQLVQSRVGTYQFLLPKDLKDDIQIRVRKQMVLLRQNLINRDEGFHTLESYLSSLISEMHKINKSLHTTSFEEIPDSFLQGGIYDLVSDDDVEELED